MKKKDYLAVHVLCEFFLLLFFVGELEGVDFAGVACDGFVVDDVDVFCDLGDEAHVVGHEDEAAFEVVDHVG